MSNRDPYSDSIPACFVVECSPRTQPAAKLWERVDISVGPFDELRFAGLTDMSALWGWPFFWRRKPFANATLMRQVAYPTFFNSASSCFRFATTSFASPIRC